MQMGHLYRGYHIFAPPPKKWGEACSSYGVNSVGGGWVQAGGCRWVNSSSERAGTMVGMEVVRHVGLGCRWTISGVGMAGTVGMEAVRHAGWGV